MGQDYREKYEKALKVELQKGISSIHHLSWNHSDNNIKNLVAIPTTLHESFNLAHDKLPPLMQSFLKSKRCYSIREKLISDLIVQLSFYKEMLIYIDIKNIIMKQGIVVALEKYGRDVIECVYKIER